MHFLGVEEGVRKGSEVFRCISAVEYSQVSLGACRAPAFHKGGVLQRLFCAVH